MTQYEKPTWSATPTVDFALEVLKDGMIIDEIKLNDKEFFILGRQPDIVDIQMDHPSLSRRHAVLNFRNDNALMLRDLNSAQGTFLNKNRCDVDTYYRVYVGDMIKFGASTRQYILNGPEEQRPPEYESENLSKLREKIDQKNTEKARRQDAQYSDGISWGFQDDSEEGDCDEDRQNNQDDLPEYLKKEANFDRKFGDSFVANIDDEEAVNEKDKAILEKIRQKERKIQNMQEENRRIFNKESSQDEGLTEGQNRAVARNDVTIEKLTHEIDELIQTIKSKNLRRQENKSAEQHTSKRGYSEISDDIEYDTTDVTADVTTNWRLKKKLAKQSK